MNRLRLVLLLIAISVVACACQVTIPSRVSPTAPSKVSPEATPKATRVLPTPTPPPTQPLPEKSVTVVKDHVIHCRESVESPVMAGDFWPAWIVEVDGRDYWVSHGNGDVIVQGPSGAVLNTVSATFVLAADRVGFVVPDSFLQVRTVGGKGSKVERVSLELDKIQWKPSDGSPNQYDQVQATFVEHEVGAGEYPRHSIEVMVHNGSDFAMNAAYLFGLIIDSDGEPVDIVWSGNQRQSIPFGETATLIARSTSSSGRCIGPRDPTAYYEVHYWIDFKTYSGELTTIYAVEKGEAWDYSKVWAEIDIEYIRAECDGDNNIAIIQLTNNGDSPHSVVPGVTVYADVSHWSRDYGWWNNDKTPIVVEPHSSKTVRYLLNGHISGDVPPGCVTSKIFGYSLRIDWIDGVDYEHRVKKTTQPSE